MTPKPFIIGLRVLSVIGVASWLIPMAMYHPWEIVEFAGLIVAAGLLLAMILAWCLPKDIEW